MQTEVYRRARTGGPGADAPSHLEVAASEYALPNTVSPPVARKKPDPEKTSLLMKTPHHLAGAIRGLLGGALLSLIVGTGLSADIHVGLVSYWPLDVDSGGTTPDLGFGNDLTVNNGPTLVTGQRGSAFFFSGASQYLSRAHDTSPLNDGLPIFLAPAGYTIALWVKAAPQAASRAFFAEGWSGNNNPVLMLATDKDANGPKMSVLLRTTPGNNVILNVKSVSTVCDNNWHHIAWVDRRGTVELYVDGVLDSANFNYAPYDLSLYSLNQTAIGALWRMTPGSYFTGSIDEVAAWERPLTQAQVQEVMANGIPTPIAPAAPSLLQPLDGTPIAFGDRATFSGNAGGQHPFSYQWLKDGVALTDQTNSTLVLNYLTETGTNEITVEVSNPIGSITNSVELVVLPDPAPDIASGLISHWPLNEATGAPAMTPDLYSHNDMALTNMDSSNLAGGQFGNALTFDGVEEYGMRCRRGAHFQQSRLLHRVLGQSRSASQWHGVLRGPEYR